MAMGGGGGGGGIVAGGEKSQCPPIPYMKSWLGYPPLQTLKIVNGLIVLVAGTD